MTSPMCSKADTKPIVWLIGGSDSGGGAGIQADLLTVQDFGCHGCTVISAITAQNSVATTAVYPLPVAQFLAQLDTLAADLPPAVIKIGLLPTAELALELADWLARRPECWPVSCKVIWDPVLTASTGAALAELPPAVVKKLLRQVDVLTPNLPELAVLTQAAAVATAVTSVAASDQLRRLQDDYQGAVLLKGGHASDCAASQQQPQHSASFNTQPSSCSDLWQAAHRTDLPSSPSVLTKSILTQSVLTQPRLATPHQHGTGCTLASAIAAAFALGYTADDAIALANAYLHRALQLGYATGAGAGCLGRPGVASLRRDDFACWQRREAPLPTRAGLNQPVFARLPQHIGLYPVVDDLKWLKRLLPHGVSTIQLRLKNLPQRELEQQIAAATELCRDYQIQLFINDHWQLALKYQAFGVHLGQEDLATADLAAIAAQGLRLGVSTHGYAELARVFALEPSYIALGHIFPTATKVMPSSPQGLKRLGDYVRCCGDIPTVAIGGIGLENIAQVVATGVHGVAVVSAISTAAMPEKALQLLQQACQGADHGFSH